MREFITPDRIANQIRMRRSSHKGSFLIVEGRNDKLVIERKFVLEV
jgi:5S rRNA maturation endonuclease (ribonuclease M5)